MLGKYLCLSIICSPNPILRCQELEAELIKVRSECEALRSRSRDPTDTAAPMTSSVAKVVQPTATVSSVPVSGPSKSLDNFRSI